MPYLQVSRRDFCNFSHFSIALSKRLSVSSLSSIQIAHAYAKDEFAGVEPVFFVVVVQPFPLVKEACLDSHAGFSYVDEGAADFQDKPFVCIIFFTGSHFVGRRLIGGQKEICLILSLFLRGPSLRRQSATEPATRRSATIPAVESPCSAENRTHSS